MPFRLNSAEAKTYPWMDPSFAGNPETKGVVWCKATKPNQFCVAIGVRTKFIIDGQTEEIIGIRNPEYPSCFPGCPVGRRAIDEGTVTPPPET